MFTITVAVCFIFTTYIYNTSVFVLSLIILIIHIRCTCMSMGKDTLYINIVRIRTLVSLLKLFLLCLNLGFMWYVLLELVL